MLFALSELELSYGTVSVLKNITVQVDHGAIGLLGDRDPQRLCVVVHVNHTSLIHRRTGQLAPTATELSEPTRKVSPLLNRGEDLPGQGAQADAQAQWQGVASEKRYADHRS